MRIEVLGCSGGVMPGEKTSCYLINHGILVDAGSVASALSFDEQIKINHVLITHSHNDHIKDLGFLADNIVERETPILVYSTSEIISKKPA